MSSRQAPTFYILHGEDEFSRQADVLAFRARMGDPTTAQLNTSQYDGKTASAAEVIAAAQNMPFLSDKRLVIVDGMLAWLSRKGAGKTGKAELDYLVKALPTLPDYARLVFVEDQTLPDSHPVLKLVKEEPRGYAKAFNPPKDATQWIIKQVEHYGGKIEPQAATALSTIITEVDGWDTKVNLRAADSECVKLVTYVAGERTITENDVVLLTGYVADAKIGDMVDALGQRNGKLASILIHRLLEDQEALSLLGMINRQFRLLLQTREVLDAGGNSSDVSSMVGVKPGYPTQKLIQQARNFTVPQLESIHRSLLEMDFSIKTSQFKPPGIALDLFVANLCNG